MSASCEPNVRWRKNGLKQRKKSPHKLETEVCSSFLTLKAVSLLEFKLQLSSLLELVKNWLIEASAMVKCK